VNEGRLRPLATAASLRAEFDAAFAEAADAAGTPSTEDVVGIRLGAEPYALRLSELRRIHAARAIVRVPSRVPELLGIAAVRGIVVPVYDLAALLGRPFATRPRWIALTRGADAVGLAFGELEGHERVDDTVVAGTHVHAAGTVRAIVDIAAVERAIRGKSGGR
jgi:purine-binding chemotaxis protein CheW